MSASVIFIHGINNQKTGYSDDLFSASLGFYKLRLVSEGHRLELVDKEAQKFVQKEIMWADCTSDLLSQYLHLQYDNLPHGIWKGIKKGVDPLVIQILRYTDEKRKGGRIIERVRESFEEAVKDAPEAVYVVAHSLGSVIAFDYLFGFDKNFRISPKIKVKALITMGSPIPIFTAGMGHPASDLKLPENLERWVNLIDQHDGVARYCSPAFRNPIVQDIHVNTGFWMVASHSGYWESKDAAEALGRIFI